MGEGPSFFDQKIGNSRGDAFLASFLPSPFLIKLLVFPAVGGLHSGGRINSFARY